MNDYLIIYLQSTKGPLFSFFLWAPLMVFISCLADRKTLPWSPNFLLFNMLSFLTSTCKNFCSCLHGFYYSYHSRWFFTFSFWPLLAFMGLYALFSFNLTCDMGQVKQKCLVLENKWLFSGRASSTTRLWKHFPKEITCKGIWVTF